MNLMARLWHDGAIYGALDGTYGAQDGALDGANGAQDGANGALDGAQDGALDNKLLWSVKQKTFALTRRFCYFSGRGERI